MPFSTGALWPTLKAGKTATAADMNSKFEWVEGDRLPMVNGNLTSSAYDWGTSSYPWKSLYSNNMVLGGNTLTSEREGDGGRNSAYIINSGGSLTVAFSYKISSVARIARGTYEVTCPGFNYASSTTFCGMKANAFGNSYIYGEGQVFIINFTEVTTGSKYLTYDIETYNIAGNYTDVSFGFIGFFNEDY